MPAARPLLPAVRLAFGVALRVGAWAREAVLVVAFVAALELIGPHSPHDGVDLLVLVAAALGVMLLRQAARAGLLPVTARAARALWGRGAALGRRLSPRFAVAFRPSPAAGALPDRTLLTPMVALGVVTLLALLLGARTFGALAFVKAHVSYVLYLVGLVVLWGTLAVGVVFGSIAAAHWLRAATNERAGWRRHVPLALFAVLWVVGLVLLTVLPGASPVAALLVIAWWRGRRLSRLPAGGYLFCRRDEAGRPRAVPVHLYLQRLHAALVLLLALVIVLGQGQRLWIAQWPAGAFAFTTWLGVLASLCALLLAARAGTHFESLMGAGEVPPEVPLTPTLWIRTREGDAHLDEPWVRVARDHGWLVLRGLEPPAHAFDLVLGDSAHASRFVPRPPADDEDARFQLERRFHVLLRRRFHRRFRSLYKRLRAETPGEGSGYLFCPHVWLVPGVVRDVEPTRRRRGAPASVAGPAFYGPPYARAFPPRVRRYLGSVLRTLAIDIVFWEDAVGWPDIRRVLGVAFETYDQGRAPLVDRHFLGLPRVRVTIQEEQAEPTPGALGRSPQTPGSEPQAAGHARILLILRDRGGHEEPITSLPTDSWIRTPSLVGG